MDRAILLAHAKNEALICSGCGNYIDQATDKQHVAVVHPVQCAGCFALEKVAEKHENDKGDAAKGVHRWAELIHISVAKARGLIR